MFKTKKTQNNKETQHNNIFFLAISLLAIASLVGTATTATTQQAYAQTPQTQLNISLQDVNGGIGGGPVECFPNGDARIVVSLSNVFVPFDSQSTVLVDGEATLDPVFNEMRDTIGLVNPVFAILQPDSQEIVVLFEPDGTQDQQFDEGTDLLSFPILPVSRIFEFGWPCAPTEPTDEIPPVISGADDQTVEAARGAQGAEVTFEVTATDDVDGAVDVTCTPESGSTFAIGDTTVTCTATDAAGNEGTASFTVTVNAPEPPPLNEVFPDQGSCVTEANNNPNAEFTKDDCKNAFKVKTK